MAPFVRYAYNNNKLLKDFSKSVAIFKDMGKIEKPD
jgi:hypothetical protein